MARKIISLYMLLLCVNADAVNYIPENQVQAVLLGLNSLGLSELLCYKDLRFDYSSLTKR